MDRNALFYFLAIAEKMSFQKASQMLGVPTSTLSRKIAELEAELGTRLLNRTTRHMSMTETGHEIYLHCQQIEDEYGAIHSIAQNSKDQPQGLVRVSVPVTLGRMMFAQWCVDFTRKFPEIQLDIRLSDCYEDLVEHQIDVAIRVGELSNSSLICKPLGTTPRWLICSRKMADQYKPDSLAKLNDMPLISLKTEQMQGDRWKLIHKKHKQIVSVKPVIQINDMMSIMDVVRADAGVSLIPYFVAKPYLDTGEVVRILPDYQGEAASFHMLYQNRNQLPRKIRVFIDFISELSREEIGG